MTKVARGQRPARFQAYTVSQLLETYRDPRAVLLEIAGTDTAKLATTLNCSLADALAERRLCAQAALPYVCAKQPIAVDMRTTRTIHLNLVTESQYEELVAVAATEEQPDDGSFSMQLLPAAQPAEVHNTAQTAPDSKIEPTTTQAGTQPGGDRPVARGLAADVSQGPGDRADPRVEWLPPLSDWWRRIDGSARTQPMPDTAPAADAPDRWERADGNATWGPDTRKGG
jgi:hypothetical protein